MADWLTTGLEIAGIRLQVATSYAPWDRYVKAHFAPVLANGLPAAQTREADIVVRVEWQDQPWRAKAMRAEESDRFPDRLGGSIVRSEREGCWVQKLRGSQRLGLIASWEGGRLRIEGAYRRKALKERARAWLGGSETQRFFELTYPLIYYPLWFYLEATAGWHVLHASAVSRSSGAIIFAGLEGVGKTTLALALAGEGSTLLADNLIWYNEQQVMGVPEPIRLHDPSGPLLERVRLRPLPIGTTQKGFFALEGDSMGAARPRAVLLPVFGRVTDIEPLEAEACADRMLATSPLTGELGPYVPFAAWMSLVRPVPGLETVRRQRLVALLRGCRCGILRMRRGEGAATIRRVLDWAKERAG